MSANNPYRTFVEGFVRVLTEGGAIGSRDSSGPLGRRWRREHAPR